MDVIPIWREALALQASGGTGVYVLVTAVRGHAPQVVGARMLVGADGGVSGTIGGGAVEAAVVARAAEVLAAGRPETVSYKLKAELGMCCGGSMEVYMEPIVPVPRVVLLGAGHVGAATAAVAVRAGFDVLVIDARTEMNAAGRFPPEVTRVVAPPLDALRTLEQRPSDLVVVLTHDHALDKELLRAALEGPAAYVGMIGSTRKVDAARRHLRLAGVPEERIAAAHMPVGLDILAETPEEIAVAIVAELIRERRRVTSAKNTRGAPVASLRDRAADR